MAITKLSKLCIAKLEESGVSVSILNILENADSVEHAIELLEFDRDEINKVINFLNDLV